MTWYSLLNLRTTEMFYFFFFFFWLCWVFTAVQTFSSCGEQGLLSNCGGRASHYGGFSLQSTGSVGRGFSSCSMWANTYGSQLENTGSTAVVHTSLVAPQHVGSSQIRDETHVSCVGWRILYHWATRETPRTTEIFKSLSNCRAICMYSQCVLIDLFIQRILE